MVLTIEGGASSLLEQKKIRLAVLWEITRVDGTIFRFTSHSNTLTFLGDEYVPSGGGNPTATRKEGNLKGSDKTFAGAITSDDITNNDLRAGLFRKAEITEYQIDWKYPWAGPYETKEYVVVKTQFTGVVWAWELESKFSVLQQEVGETYTRHCRYELGDSRCGVDLSAITESGATVSGVTDDRSIFQSSDITSQAYDYVFGQVVWLTGNNVGQISEIKKRDATELELTLPTANAIEAGDTCDILPGCPRTKTACVDDFDNYINFGGFFDIPGTRAMLKSPTSVAGP